MGNVEPWEPWRGGRVEEERSNFLTVSNWRTLCHGEKILWKYKQVLGGMDLDGNPGTRAPGHRSPGPWSQGIFLFLFLFFLAGVHFFQGLDEVDFFDESLSSLSRLG